MTREALNALIGVIKGRAGEDAPFEAKQILKEYCKGFAYGELSESEFDLCLRAAKRRAAGEPLQYVFGRWEFYGLDFSVGEGVLIPRADTEVLAELLIDRLNGRDGVFVDLCAGSGCVGIAAAKLTGCRGYEIELSDKAADYCAENISRHGLTDRLRLIRGDIYDGEVVARFADGSLDAIVANPPYLTEREMNDLQPEVRYEPTQALYGGRDGLEHYRRIFSVWKAKLRPDGLFAVETGDGQSDVVCELMRAEGFTPSVHKDMAGLPRVCAAYLKGK